MTKLAVFGPANHERDKPDSRTPGFLLLPEARLIIPLKSNDRSFPRVPTRTNIRSHEAHA